MIHQHPGGLTLTKRVVDYAAFLPGAKVVDVGCGTGITVEYLCTVCRLQAVGVDLAESRLEQGRVRMSGLPLIQASGESLPFDDASMDGVLAECSLSVMQDSDRVLQEIHRILVGGGKLAITDLYVRNTAADCLAGTISCKELRQRLEEIGFHITIWEDQSAYLREFVACFLMEYGSMDALWQCTSQGKNTKQMGYFLLVAEKRQTKG
ncbi:DVU_1556 family methyltransferase [Sporomusa sp.]|jgi:ubiquinone/menaquinone biosynthesis C-methylase UbiE|uniref:DVU_1556 family methyltransferase n=1 Tax=Sporomusa sp. TaxID=2078658 RepID=UPI002CC9DFE4|nr:class I SAM-dependent methyltransferase [Sporomusa sp.]MDF2874988.1 Glycine/sarcosine/dimethylglycine N-methyltransferase [Sporomusa sp.]HWR09025.1 class I SAM-dependent methyltransferase [Sporomusa sp.]